MFQLYTGVFCRSGVILYLLTALGCWKMLEKAGQDGWKGLIPVCNLYMVYKICWTPAAFWMYLITAVSGSCFLSAARFFWLQGPLVLLGLAAVVIRAIWCCKVSSAFGHKAGFAVGLFFLEPFFVMILGFGSSRYLEKLQTA